MTTPEKSSPFGQFTILDEPDAQDVQFLEDRIYEFNVEQTGITDGQLMAIFLRNGAGDIIAGLYGWTWGQCCEIKTLWIHKQWRKIGLGTYLLAAAEAEARARGAKQIVLTTHSFQAPDFYKRFGFEQVGAIEDYPIGYQHIFMRKKLN
jgi:N-acetylglutamate synthase-like GNAT family acetyltransferase